MSTPTHTPKLEIAANRFYLHAWSEGKTRTRFDFDPPDHTIEDMISAGDTYFRTVADWLRHGDLVYVTDANGKRATLIINVVDAARGRVAWDIDVAHSERIVIPAGQEYVIRHRGRGRFAVLDREGKVIAGDMASREEAERELTNLARKAA